MAESISRRDFLNRLEIAGAAVMAAPCTAWLNCALVPKRPNILFAISDDQSWLHTGVNGCKFVQTPAFDRVAQEGVLFSNAFVSAPQCSPNRASILTGRPIWQLEEAGTHASNFPRKFRVFTDELENAGYFIGYTGKPWGPGNWSITGWPRNPAGPEFNQIKVNDKPASGIGNNDYAANFEAFLSQRPKDAPFFFWYGCTEPHRNYEEGSGIKAGKNPEDVSVPGFLPDDPIVKSDILDYALEIDWFDSHLARMMNLLEAQGELDNTLIIVTSDNGMPFPRAKANLYDYGTRMPLAICWPKRIPAGRSATDFISFVDLAPTILQAAGLRPLPEMTGKSFLDILTSRQQGRVDPQRDRAFFGRERHTHARPENLGYPSRAIRTDDYLYIWNLKPDRWPAGDPFGPDDGYFDIDGSPSKRFLLENRGNPQIENYAKLALDKRPEEELYAIKDDPYCLLNLADEPNFESVKTDLRNALQTRLKQQGDPRVTGTGDIFDSYPRYSPMRDFPGFKEQAQYNPQFQ